MTGLRTDSLGEDSRRHQYLVQVVLIALFFLAATATGDTFIHSITTAHSDQVNFSPLISLLGLTAVGGLYVCARKGWHRFSASVVIAMLYIAATYMIVRWGIDLPTGLLVYAMMIVMAGVLMGTRLAVAVAAVSVATVSAVGWLQVTGIISVDSTWMKKALQAGDGFVFSAILGITATIAWLSNREIDKSLGRARVSEAALKHERDSLEVRVQERTKQLEQAQMERMIELERFAEFGRLSSGLLHDIANPLTVAALNLEQLGDQRRSQLVSQAHKSIRHMERYVEAARRQLQHNSELKHFSVGAELRQVIDMLSHKARSCRVSIDAPRQLNYLLYGDAVKFNHLLSNVVANAIDAYQDIPHDRPGRAVRIEVLRVDGSIEISVQDWGVGIHPKELGAIFKPFQSFKRNGTGLGLAMVRELCENDFAGSVTAISDTLDGTIFTMRLGGKREAKA